MLGKQVSDLASGAEYLGPVGGHSTGGIHVGRRFGAKSEIKRRGRLDVAAAQRLVLAVVAAVNSEGAVVALGGVDDVLVTGDNELAGGRQVRDGRGVHRVPAGVSHAARIDDWRAALVSRSSLSLGSSRQKHREQHQGCHPSQAVHGWRDQAYRVWE